MAEMYEELVKRLRNAAHWADKGLVITPSVVLEAADAIEKLCSFVGAEDADRMEAYNKGLLEGGIAQRAEDEKWLPRWIPVTERLPEDGKFVLVCNDDGHMMIAKHETETYEWYYKYTNYDFDIWDNEEQGPVRYWMPLPSAPEPPKEET